MLFSPGHALMPVSSLPCTSMASLCASISSVHGHNIYLCIHSCLQRHRLHLHPAFCVSPHLCIHSLCPGIATTYAFIDLPGENRTKLFPFQPSMHFCYWWSYSILFFPANDKSNYLIKMLMSIQCSRHCNSHSFIVSWIDSLFLQIVHITNEGFSLAWEFISELGVYTQM